MTGHSRDEAMSQLHQFSLDETNGLLIGMKLGGVAIAVSQLVIGPGHGRLRHSLGIPIGIIAL